MSPSFDQRIRQIQPLGFGLGFKNQYWQDLKQVIESPSASPIISWVEIIAENYMNKGGTAFEKLGQLRDLGLPIVSHGVNLSLGSVDPLNKHYLEALEALFYHIQPPWFSDHLCFGSLNGHYAQDLLPLPFTEETVAHCIEKIQAVQHRLEPLFLVENISSYVQFDVEMTEAEFIRRIVEGADCGLLLDVNNVYVNAKNHGLDPHQFIQALPLERVVEIHMAGHLKTDALLIDTHGEPICDDVFNLFAWTYPQCPNVKGVLLERDTHQPPFEELVQELQALQQLAQPRKEVSCRA